MTQTISDHPAVGSRSGAWFHPHVDILETPDEVLLVADTPGVSGEQIDVRFENGQLTIVGRVPPRHRGEFLRREYGVGNFYRDFRVSEKVDPTGIQAEYSDGVLTVHLPKAERVRPRKIAVHVPGRTVDADPQND